MGSSREGGVEVECNLGCGEGFEGFVVCVRWLMVRIWGCVILRIQVKGVKDGCDLASGADAFVNGTCG